MSENTGGNADRDAFLAALGQVFKEYRDVSRGYAITNHARLAELVGADAESRGEITIGTGGTVTVNIATGTKGGNGECIGFLLNPFTGEWDCVYFMAP
jgi:hypothetical protein